MMKKSTYFFIGCVTALFILGGVTLQAQTYVDQWGFISNGGWDFVPGAQAGDAGMTGASTPTAWLGLYGQFDSLTATVGNAVVVTGQIEFSGGDLTNWSALRYGFYNNHLNAGNLQYAGTDSATWSGAANSVNGYIFTPITAPGNRVSWRAGGNHTQGVIIDGGWNTTNNWSGVAPAPLGEVIPAPAGASLTAGTYDFAMSIEPQGDGTNELRFYLIKDDDSYWFGGTIIDDVPAPDTYNAVVFGIIDNIDTGMNSFNVLGVNVYLGAPITVPEAPFSAFYVSDWGFISNGGWDFVPHVQVGNAGMTGESTPTAWLGLYGQFSAPATATVDSALIVTGKLEFFGGDLTNWSALRYGFYNNQNAGNLQYAGTDSATWSGDASHVDGYIFTPITAPGNRVSWRAGGNHTQGVMVNGGWNTTNNWGGDPPVPLGEVIPAPAGASLTAGTYDFAMSIQPQGDGTNELRFYLIKDDDSYWFGGTVIDDVPAPATYNAVVFGVIDHIDTGMDSLNVLDVHVDMGDPITVPEPPFSDFYVADWGFISNGGWDFVPHVQVGNAGMTGTSTPTAWLGLYGQFSLPVKATVDSALIVTGKLEFFGGDLTNWSALRYGLYNNQNAGDLQYAGTDSATWSGDASHVDGYIFTPITAPGNRVSWRAGGNHTQGVMVNGGWNTTNNWGGDPPVPLGEVIPAPARASLTAGTYDFGFSVQPQGDGTNELRWFLEKDDHSYWFGGTVIDDVPAPDTYNAIVIGVIDHIDTGMDSLNVLDVHVDMGDPITVPEKPWSDYYADAWGFLGGRTGGWEFVPGAQVGNAGVRGTSPNTDWAVLRGGFIDATKAPVDQALKVSGTITFEGGGFEGFASLRYGMFYAENPGEIVEDNGDSTTTHWTGSEDNHSGYLFLPVSGTNDIPIWPAIGGTGTWGAVSDHVWWSTNGPNNYILGSELQSPQDAVASAGAYDFSITVQALADGGNYIEFSLVKDDQSYSFSGQAYDHRDLVPNNEFNGVEFGLNTWDGTTTTAMMLTDVFVQRVDALVAIDDPRNRLIPERFSLEQNYPNPFNPTTTIEFNLPQASDVKLVLYDVVGRTVAELASGYYAAGSYKINFNAANLGSGIYFYRLKAKDFVSVKKLILLK